MDTEEHVKIKRLQGSGRPETDEGPYYHESWWESYKGGVKGKLGGLIIGALTGAAVGAVAVIMIGMLGNVALGAGAIAAIVGGFSAGGLLYGAHEFSEVGKVTGAVAAAHEKAELRMKAFEAGKFAEIKQEIGELKALVTGKEQNAKDNADNINAIRLANEVENAEYRTSHCDEHCPPNKKWVFGKVAIIGLMVGAAAGAILAFGAGDLIAHALGAASGPMTEAGIFAASVTSMGLFGASFGINRDVFRQVFDKTDLWFKGITKNGRERARDRAVALEALKTQVQQVQVPANVATAVIYENPIDYPQSQTYHRDRVLAAAEKALLSFDHTRATPQ